MSPSYAHITRKKQVVCSDSSYDDSIEHFPKKIGWKTKKETHEEELQSEKEDQWTQAKKAGNSNQNQRKKGTDGKKLKGDVVVGKLPHLQLIENVSSNQFAALSTLDAPALEE